MSDVAPKELSHPLIDPHQVMICGRPFIGRLVVLNEHILEVIPSVDDIELEASEPIHCSGLEHKR